MTATAPAPILFTVVVWPAVSSIVVVASAVVVATPEDIVLLREIRDSLKR